jgi:hypothetical protein
MKVTEFPETFEREIHSVSPAGTGWSVEFRCGHMVWFAIEPDPRYAYNCSMCFDEHLKAARSVRPADKESA